MIISSFTIGPLVFTWESDGDDPGTGWILVENINGHDSDRLRSTLSDWQLFLEELGET